MRTLKRSKAVVAITAGLLLAGGGIAYADNLQSDGDGVLATTGDSNWSVGNVCAGASATRSVPVYARHNGSGSQVFKNDSFVSISGAVTSGPLSVESGSKTINLPSTWESLAQNTLSSPVSIDVSYTAPTTVGGFTGTVRFTGTGVNTSNSAIDRTDDLTVSGTVIACDTTPPVITPNITGTEGANGWYTSDINVSWTVTDAESALASSTGCGTTSITSDQTATTYTCSATTAGGTDSESVTIKRDATAPVIDPGDVTDTTWRNATLTQAFTSSDATSGLADAADASFTLEASAESQDASTPTTDRRTVTDAAGNSTVRTLSAKIDKTGPVVSYTSASGTQGSNDWYTSPVTATFTAIDSLSGPASNTGTDSSDANEGSVTLSSPLFSDAAGNSTAAGGASQTFNIDLTDPTTPTFSSFPSQAYATMVPAAPTCNATDAVSGLDDCVVTGYSTAVGPHTLTATATDNAGRIRTSTLTYSVSAWTLRGFTSPVDMSGVWNVVKGGSTVSLKFEAFAGAELTSTSAIRSFTQRVVACPGSTAAVDEVEIVSTGGTTLRYDSTAGQFIQNWQTPKKAGTCYVVTMTTQDGSSISANFMLK